MNGFDLDGVISIGLYPGKDDIIITGRSYEESEETIKYLERKGIHNEIFFNKVKFDEKTRKNSALHKVNILKKYSINTFFEDDEIQYGTIKGKMKKDINLVLISHDNLINKDNVRRDEFGKEI